MNLTRTDLLRIIFFLAVFSFFILAASTVFGDSFLPVGFIVLAALALFCVAEFYRRLVVMYNDIQAETRESYRQLECWISLLGILNPQFPLPSARGYAASPDFLLELTKLVLEHKPKLVVELGSGLSSLVVGLALNRQVGGKLVTFEHDLSYLESVQKNLNNLELNENVEIVHAPLKKQLLMDEERVWYDISLESFADESIGLLIVDGPPMGTDILARYPALPAFYKKLAPNAIVVVDDGKRDDEKRMVSTWNSKFELGEVRYMNLEAGAFFARK